jgi:hypothetical protein
VVAAALLVQQAEPSLASSHPHAHPGLFGVVNDVCSGAGVAAAMVDAWGPTVTQAMTDVQGRFSVRPVPEGTYFLIAEANGYEPSDRVPALVVPSGEVSPDVPLFIELLPSSGAADGACGSRDLGVQVAG